MIIAIQLTEEEREFIRSRLVAESANNLLLRHAHDIAKSDDGAYDKLDRLLSKDSNIIFNLMEKFRN